MLKLCFFPPIFLVTLLFIPFFGRRFAVIPLTVRTSFNKWGEMRTLYETSPRGLTWNNVSSVVWCQAGGDTSPQCRCFKRYFDEKYLPDALNLSLSLERIGEKHGRGVVMECLRSRSSWRKETCGQFCRLHLCTPVMLSCLYMILFFSRLMGEFSWWEVVLSVYLPPVLALVFVVSQLAIENVGGILASLSILSAYTESVYVMHGATLEQVFWSYHRYLCGAIAVWAAVTHQARDVFNVGMYGLFGFTAGLLAYTIFLTKAGRPCKANAHIAITMWLCILAVSATFLVVIQQHWYESSSQMSSLVSVVCLLVCLCQCLFQTPYDIVPVPLHVLLSLVVLCVAFYGAVYDTWVG